jgi:hypothetical protein
MNAVALNIPISALLCAFNELPPGGQIQSVTVDSASQSLRVVYHHRDIKTPLDYPLDYMLWLRRRSEPAVAAVRLPAMPQAGPVVDNRTETTETPREPETTLEPRENRAARRRKSHLP